MTTKPKIDVAPGDYVALRPPDAEIHSGTRVTRIELPFVVYAKILDPLDGSTGKERDHLAASYARQADLRYAQAFSSHCEDGEYGDVLASTVVRKLTEAEFEAARLAGWPEALTP